MVAPRPLRWYYKSLDVKYLVLPCESFGSGILRSLKFGGEKIGSHGLSLSRPRRGYAPERR